MLLYVCLYAIVSSATNPNVEIFANRQIGPGFQFCQRSPLRKMPLAPLGLRQIANRNAFYLTGSGIARARCCVSAPINASEASDKLRMQAKGINNMPVMTLHSPRISTSHSTAALLASVFAVAFTACKGTSDATLTSKIQATLAADSAVAGQPVQVAVQDGVATLTGSVSNDAQRVLAARDAAGVDGVKKVVDSITIGTATAAAEPLPMPTPSPAPAAPVTSKTLPVTKPTPQIQQPAPIHQSAPIERPQQAYNPPPPPPQPQRSTCARTRAASCTRRTAAANLQERHGGLRYDDPHPDYPDPR